LEFAISEIKKNTRRFAKRQLTWFRKNDSTIWMPHNATIPMILEKIKNNTNE
jgi:tRNA dimethylallyltransferase